MRRDRARRFMLPVALAASDSADPTDVADARTTDASPAASIDATPVVPADAGPPGHNVWSMRFGDAADYQTAWSVAVDGSNNVIIAGELEGTAVFGGGELASLGGRDVFVLTTK